MAVIAICLTSHFYANAQNDVLAAHFPGGSEAFWNKFQENFVFPASTMKGKRYGTSLMSLTINDDGLPVRSRFFSQIDEDISAAISRALSKMSDDWKRFPPETVLYLSIRFSFNNDYIGQLKLDKSVLTKEFAEFLYIQETSEDQTINYKKDYSQKLKAAKSAYKNAAFGKAKGGYTRLIAINPYELDFYTKRIEIETVTGAKTNACNDVRVLHNLLNYQGAVLLHGCD